MSEILNNYKRWQPRLILNTEKYLDFVLSRDNSRTIELDGNMTKRCLISFIDMNDDRCIDNSGTSVVSSDDYKYINAINDGSTLRDFGLTGIDNGMILYDKDEITLDDFVNILTGTTVELSENDLRLHLYNVNGNTKHYNYNSEYIINESGDTKEKYYSFNGGFLQGFYKLEGINYEVLPRFIENGWNFEFVIRPRTDYEHSGFTLNDEHPENNGIFFYMGTRSENKFGRFYGEDLSKYPDRKSYSGDCFDICNKSANKSKQEIKENSLLWKFLFGEISFENCCECIKNAKQEDIDEIVSSLTTCAIEISTSEGHIVDSNKYFEITTDNKFLIFDRTKDGFTTKTWNEGDIMTIIQKKLVTSENLFLLMNRGKSGYTTKTIDKYFDTLTGQSENYSILNDSKNNSFALKINDDGSIGYKYLIKDCNNENGYSITEEKSFPNMITNNEWNVVNVMVKALNGQIDKCGNQLGERKMVIYIYVNGYLKFISKELPMFNFRALNDYYDKQEGVPFNLSLGGGTQGLAESMWLDNYKHPYCKVLPIEENFGGSFIGDIRSFKFYDCPLQYHEIKNNYIYESNLTL